MAFGKAQLLLTGSAAWVREFLKWLKDAGYDEDSRKVFVGRPTVGVEQLLLSDPTLMVLDALYWGDVDATAEAVKELRRRGYTGTIIVLEEHRAPQGPLHPVQHAGANALIHHGTVEEMAGTLFRLVDGLIPTTRLRLPFGSEAPTPQAKLF